MNARYHREWSSLNTNVLNLETKAFEDLLFFNEYLPIDHYDQIVSCSQCKWLLLCLKKF